MSFLWLMHFPLVLFLCFLNYSNTLVVAVVPVIKHLSLNIVLGSIQLLFSICGMLSIMMTKKKMTHLSNFLQYCTYKGEWTASHIIT